jgi:hypothetical protein
VFSASAFAVGAILSQYDSSNEAPIKFAMLDWHYVKSMAHEGPRRKQEKEEDEEANIPIGICNTHAWHNLFVFTCDRLALVDILSKPFIILMAEVPASLAVAMEIGCKTAP